MQRFTQLYFELDETNRTSEKVAALHRYFSEVPARDAAWALFFLTGQKLKRAVSSPQLRHWSAEEAGLPAWLFEECYEAVGDLAETAALLMPEAPEAGAHTAPLHQLVEERLVPLRSLPESERRGILVETWNRMDQRQRFVWNKLITGEFRVGVARTLVVRALAGVAGVDPAAMAHRLMGDWRPTEDEFARIMSGEAGANDPRRPYPFYLAYPLELPPPPDSSFPGRGMELKLLSAQLRAQLGEVEQWQAEWKWDGIRAQLIRRGGHVLIWSRGEELITDRFPELAQAGLLLPDGTVLDGEILAWLGGRPMRFGDLQKRITVKTVSRKLLAEVPAAFMAYDVLESGGQDIRPRPLSERRTILENLIINLYAPADDAAAAEGLNLRIESSDLPLKLSPVLYAESWSDLAMLRAESRENDAEGLMLKRITSPYQVGRVRGDWWKWKIDPFTIDAVLIYAQPGHGRRASLFTDYTFGLWRGDELVPVAKAYSGLTDAEIRDLDAWIRSNTLERFGPVRTVRPELVFEIAFEGIQPSTRHKSGVAVRFPRILRQRHDKPAEEADTLETLRAMAGLPDQGGMENPG